MHTMAFDTLLYAREAEQAGFSKNQAEFQAEALAKFFNQNLATKGDVHNLRKDIHHLRKEMVHLEEKLVSRLTIKLGYMLIGTLTLLPIILKLVDKIW